MKEIDLVPRPQTWEVLKTTTNLSTLHVLGEGLAHPDVDLRAQCFEYLLARESLDALRIVIHNWNRLNAEQKTRLYSQKLQLIDACKLAFREGDVHEQITILGLVSELELTALLNELIHLSIGKPGEVQQLATKTLFQLCEKWGQNARQGRDVPSTRLPMLECLHRAIGSDDRNQHVHLVDAWLMLVSWEDQLQRSLLNDPKHVAFRVILNRFEQCKYPAVLELLAGYLWRKSTPKSVLGIITDRPEREFALQLAAQLSQDTEEPTMNRLRELPPLACFESFRTSTPNAREEAQVRIWRMIAANSADLCLVLSTAVKFVTAACTEGRRAAADLVRLCRHPGPDGIVTACYESSCNLASNNAMGRAVDGIAGWLDSPSTFLKKASQDFFRDFNYDSFKDYVRENPPQASRFFADLLFKVNPDSIDSIVKELDCPSPTRRLMGLELIKLFSELPEMEEKLAELTRDTRLSVRLLAIELLIRMESELLLPLIPDFLAEPTTDIQEAAQRALKLFKKRAEEKAMSEAVA